MNRHEMLERIRSHRSPWDIAIIGGGATGLGLAVDAASRGYDTVLFEQHDFGKGTSSRSTKLIHGGIRYLQQGRLGLVREALRDASLLRNASHLVHPLSFLVPFYRWWERPFYRLGLGLYDFIAGRGDFARTRGLSRESVMDMMPTLNQQGLRGGIVYQDGQFDDARLLISLARTAADHGAVVLNYAPVKKPARGSLLAQDAETGEEFRIEARAILNATGMFADAFRDGEKPIIVPSRGSHVVLPQRFLPGETALLVPRTSDDRLLFIIPWHEHALVGTTDIPVASATLEPKPTEEEIEFLLETASGYLSPKPMRSDVLSTWAGIRPLVAPQGVKEGKTAKLSRKHYLRVDENKLITLTGGKWTTYRKMAEDGINLAAQVGDLPKRACMTHNVRLHEPALVPPSEALHPELSCTKEEVIRAVREEMARSLEDVLARRSRALFLNARASMEIAPVVARIMAEELGHGQEWIEEQSRRFDELAKGYL